MYVLYIGMYVRTYVCTYVRAYVCMYVCMYVCILKLVESIRKNKFKAKHSNSVTNNLSTVSKMRFILYLVIENHQTVGYQVVQSKLVGWCSHDCLVS